MSLAEEKDANEIVGDRTIRDSSFEMGKTLVAVGVAREIISESRHGCSVKVAVRESTDTRDVSSTKREERITAGSRNGWQRRV